MKNVLAFTSIILFISVEIYAGSGIFMSSDQSFSIYKPVKLYGQTQLKNFDYKAAIKKKKNRANESAKIKGKLLPNAEEFTKRLKNGTTDIACIKNIDFENPAVGIIDNNDWIYKEKANVTIKKSRN